MMNYNLFAVFFLALIVHRLRRKSVKFGNKNLANQDDKHSTHTDELSNVFVSSEINLDRDSKNRTNNLDQREKSIEEEIREGIKQIERTIEKEKQNTKMLLGKTSKFYKSSLIQERLPVLLPRDDLRAYAYEGEGTESSEGSLGSAISDIRKDLAKETDESIILPPSLSEVVDLLKNLPDASLRFVKHSSGRPREIHKESSFMGDKITHGSERLKRRITPEIITERFTINSSTEELSTIENVTMNRRKKHLASSSFWSDVSHEGSLVSPECSLISKVSVIPIPTSNKTSPKIKSKASSKSSKSSKSSSGSKSSKSTSCTKKRGSLKSSGKTESVISSSHISLHV